MDTANPHLLTTCEEAGAKVGEAPCTVVLVHGRNQDAGFMRGLLERLERPEVAYVLPNAEGSSWYPESFLVHRERNEPRLGFALAAMLELRERLTAAGTGPEKTVWVGFSQGACLVLDFVARHPAAYGGVVALTGGLIGSSTEALGGDGDLQGLPVVIGTSDVDEFVPLARVEETVGHLSKMGALVELHVYTGMGHDICDDEVELVRHAVDRVISRRMLTD